MGVRGAGAGGDGRFDVSPSSVSTYLSSRSGFLKLLHNISHLDAVTFHKTMARKKKSANIYIIQMYVIKDVNFRALILLISKKSN